jgi:hypothetical protein
LHICPFLMPYAMQPHARDVQTLPRRHTSNAVSAGVMQMRQAT